MAEYAYLDDLRDSVVEDPFWKERWDSWNLLCKWLYGKTFHKDIFTISDIERCKAALDDYVGRDNSGAVMRDEEHEGYLKYHGDKGTVRLTADVMTSVLVDPIIKGFLCREDGAVQQSGKANQQDGKANSLPKMCYRLGGELSPLIDKGAFGKAVRQLRGGETDESVIKAFEAFLRVCYTKGNMTVIGKNPSSGPGACNDSWDYKLHEMLKVEPNKEEYNEAVGKDLSKRSNKDGWQIMRFLYVDGDITKHLYYMDYLSSKRAVRHIWDAFGYYGKDKPNGQYSMCDTRRNTYINWIKSADEVDKEEAAERFWYLFFTNCTKLIVQRGYRIDRNKDECFSNEDRKQLRCDFKTVGLPENYKGMDDLPDCYKRKTIIV